MDKLIHDTRTYVKSMWLYIAKSANKVDEFLRPDRVYVALGAAHGVSPRHSNVTSSSYSVYDDVLCLNQTVYKCTKLLIV